MEVRPLVAPVMDCRPGRLIRFEVNVAPATGRSTTDRISWTQGYTLMGSCRAKRTATSVTATRRRLKVSLMQAGEGLMLGTLEGWDTRVQSVMDTTGMAPRTTKALGAFARDWSMLFSFRGSPSRVAPPLRTAALPRRTTMAASRPVTWDATIPFQGILRTWGMPPCGRTHPSAAATATRDLEHRRPSIILSAAATPRTGVAATNATTPRGTLPGVSLSSTPILMMSSRMRGAESKASAGPVTMAGIKRSSVGGEPPT